MGEATPHFPSEHARVRHDCRQAGPRIDRQDQQIAELKEENSELKAQNQAFRRRAEELEQGENDDGLGRGASR